MIRSIQILVVAALLVLGVPASGAVCSSTGGTTGPTVNPITVDGMFTNPAEWSDVLCLPFLGQAAVLVYTVQNIAPASPQLYLMYDAVNHTTPLGPEFVEIRFDVQEGNRLEHYDVRCHDSFFDVFVDLMLSDPEGIDCKAGFGASPNSPIPHVMVELSVPMNVVYSPDLPIFWSANAPQPRCPPQPVPVPCRDGQAAVKPVRVPLSSILTFAGSNRTTTVIPVPAGATLADLCKILGAEIDMALVGPFKNHGDYVSQVTHATQVAVESLIAAGIIARSQGGQLLSCVVSERAMRRIP